MNYSKFLKKIAKFSEKKEISLDDIKNIFRQEKLDTSSKAYLEGYECGGMKLMPYQVGTDEYDDYKRGVKDYWNGKSF